MLWCIPRSRLHHSCIANGVPNICTTNSPVFLNLNVTSVKIGGKCRVVNATVFVVSSQHLSSLQQFLLTRGREERVADCDRRIPPARCVHDLLGFALSEQSIRPPKNHKDRQTRSHDVVDLDTAKVRKDAVLFILWLPLSTCQHQPRTICGEHCFCHAIPGL